MGQGQDTPPTVGPAIPRGHPTQWARTSKETHVFITRHTPLFLFQTDEAAGAADQAPDMQGTPDTGPTEAGIEQQPTQQEIDWAKRYSDLQPEYTRTTQEAAQLRRQNELYQSLLYAEDPDTRRQAAQELGIELDDEPDPNEGQQYLTREEWQTFQNAQRQQEQQRQEEQGVQQIEQYMDTQLDTLGVPEHLQGIIKADAVFNRDPNDQGLPDIKGAFDHFLGEVRKAEQKEWAKTKRTHHISSVGQAGTQQPNLDDDQQRQAWMAQQLADLDNAS
jgi:hypothetical protein